MATGGQASSPPGLSDLRVRVTSSWVGLTFHVPKVDMRKPSDMNSVSEFVEAFWTRSVHPETYELCLAGMELAVTMDAPRMAGINRLVPPLLVNQAPLCNIWEFF